MKHRNLALKYALAFLIMASCTEAPKEAGFLTSAIQEIRAEFAPDKRVVLFDISVEKKGTSLILKGESNRADAVIALKEKLSSKKIDFTDSIQILPSAALEGNTQAVVNISVANLRSKPKHSAELATQATLGTPVKVLKKEGGWFYIQTPDKYLSWVDIGGITLMNAKRFDKWKAGKKIIYTKTYGHAYGVADEKEVVSDLVAGGILEFVKL